jgi:ABC-type lipoprotein export system ATPase subunit
MILDLLKRLNKEDNRTLIIVTHDPTIAKQATQTIKITDGKIG